MIGSLFLFLNSVEDELFLYMIKWQHIDFKIIGSLMKVISRFV